MIKLPEPVELNPSANSVVGHSDATLKQAVRDALEEALKACRSQSGMGASHCSDAIRALIKEIKNV
jgi:hypothetical protein